MQIEVITPVSRDDKHVFDLHNVLADCVHVLGIETQDADATVTLVVNDQVWCQYPVCLMKPYSTRFTEAKLLEDKWSLPLHVLQSSRCQVIVHSITSPSLLVGVDANHTFEEVYTIPCIKVRCIGVADSELDINDQFDCLIIGCTGTSTVVATTSEKTIHYTRLLMLHHLFHEDANRIYFSLDVPNCKKISCLLKCLVYTKQTSEKRVYHSGRIE